MKQTSPITKDSPIIDTHNTTGKDKNVEPFEDLKPYAKRKPTPYSSVRPESIPNVLQRNNVTKELKIIHSDDPIGINED